LQASAQPKMQDELGFMKNTHLFTNYICNKIMDLCAKYNCNIELAHNFVTLVVTLPQNVLSSNSCPSKICIIRPPLEIEQNIYGENSTLVAVLIESASIEHQKVHLFSNYHALEIHLIKIIKKAKEKENSSSVNSETRPHGNLKNSSCSLNMSVDDNA